VSLKKLVLLLLIANLGYFGYSQGWLRALTGEESSQREPSRLAKQINPEAIQIKLIADPNPQVESSAVEICTAQHETWLVYMGPYHTPALSEKKKSELKQRGVASTDISKPSMKIGLSLGQFDSETLAKEELKRLSSKGVKTATVILWSTVTEPCPAIKQP
jgi:hypothetical protein